jgi:hypothetical protein
MAKYCGFEAEKLNSNAPLPAGSNKTSVYHDTLQSRATEVALALRRGLGIPVWLDGTVTTGWKIFVWRGGDAYSARLWLAREYAIKFKKRRYSYFFPDSR